MSFKEKGKVIKILQKITGESQNGTWEKQSFVIETLGEYAKKICFQVWGDKTKLLLNLKEGQLVTVNFNLESREYNEKWYTDATAYSVYPGEGRSVKKVETETKYENPMPSSKTQSSTEVQSAPDWEMKPIWPFAGDDAAKLAFKLMLGTINPRQFGPRMRIPSN